MKTGLKMVLVAVVLLTLSASLQGVHTQVGCNFAMFRKLKTTKVFEAFVVLPRQN